MNFFCLFFLLFAVQAHGSLLGGLEHAHGDHGHGDHGHGDHGDHGHGDHDHGHADHGDHGHGHGDHGDHGHHDSNDNAQFVQETGPAVQQNVVSEPQFEPFAKSLASPPANAPSFNPTPINSQSYGADSGNSFDASPSGTDNFDDGFDYGSSSSQSFDTGSSQSYDNSVDSAAPSFSNDRQLNQDFSNSIPGSSGADYPTYATVPETSFSCQDQQYGGYYADIEAQCQVFHICHGGINVGSFLCPNGTIFNQNYFVCDWWYNVQCESSQDSFGLNSKIGVVPEDSNYQ